MRAQPRSADHCVLGKTAVQLPLLAAARQSGELRTTDAAAAGLAARLRSRERSVGVAQLQWSLGPNARTAVDALQTAGRASPHDPMASGFLQSRRAYQARVTIRIPNSKSISLNKIFIILGFSYQIRGTQVIEKKWSSISNHESSHHHLS